MSDIDPNEQDQHDTEVVVEDDGPDVEELESDPAYSPDSEDLKKVKGG
jgi:hypothetical protein